MSSTAFKNAVRRREHYERSQPAARKKYGLLEKHKDYVKRARNFHDKQRRIQVLQQKAANKNPDEFYHKMQSSAATKKGVHQGESERPALTGDMLQLLKSQDQSYIRVKKGAEDKRVERLRSSLHMLSSKPANTHTVFVDTEEKLEEFDPAAFFDTDPTLVPRAFNRVRSADLAAAPIAPTDPVATKERKKAARAREQSYAELEERTERSTKLARLGEHMELQQALLQKGKRVKMADSEGGKAAVFRWKAVRKR